MTAPYPVFKPASLPDFQNANDRGSWTGFVLRQKRMRGKEMGEYESKLKSSRWIQATTSTPQVSETSFTLINLGRERFVLELYSVGGLIFS
jgi:hypothetical protein